MDSVRHIYASKDDIRDRYIVAVTVAGVLRNVDMLEMIVVINCAKSIVLGRPPFSKGHIAWIRHKASLPPSFEVLVVLAYPTCSALAQKQYHVPTQTAQYCSVQRFTTKWSLPVE
jgi:hypothetical protein